MKKYMIVIGVIFTGIIGCQFFNEYWEPSDVIHVLQNSEDHTPPSVQIVSPSGNEKVGELYSFTVNINDDQSQNKELYISIHPDTWQKILMNGYVFTTNLTLSQYGYYTNRAFGIDESGNVSLTDTVVFERAAVPALIFTDPQYLEKVGGSDVDLSGIVTIDTPYVIQSVTVAHGGTDYHADVTGTNWSVTLTNLPDGTNSLIAIASADNGLEKSFTNRVIIDTTGPSISVIAPTNSAKCDDYQYVFYGTVADQYSDISEMYVNFMTTNDWHPTGIYQKTNWSFLVALPDYGIYTNTVYAVDSLGNHSATNRVVVYYYVYPHVAIDSHTNGQYVSGRSITLSGTAVISNGYRMTNLQVILNNSDQVIYDLTTNAVSLDWSYTLSNIADYTNVNENRFKVRVVSDIGKIGETGWLTVTFDPDPPVLTVDYPIGGTEVGSPDYVLSGTVSDAGSGVLAVYCVLNGGDTDTALINGGNWNLPLSLERTGWQTNTVWALDAGSNSTTNMEVVFQWQASMIFVTPDGDDANPGTIDAPVVGISRAIELAVSSGYDEIRLRTGHYVQGAGLLNYGDTPDHFGFLLTNSNMKLSGGWDEDWFTNDGISVLDATGIDDTTLYVIGMITNADDVMIERLSFINGSGSLKGAGLRIESCLNVTVDRSSFLSNSTRYANGVGMYVGESSVSVMNSSFNDNVNPDNNSKGGGIYCIDSRMELTGNEFLRNNAGNYSAYYSYNCTNTFISNSWEYNDSDSSSTVFLKNSFFRIDSDFYNGNFNTAGSACVIDNNEGTISNTTIINNSCHDSAGGMSIVNSSVDMYDCIISDNVSYSSTGGAGGIYVSGNGLNMYRSSVIDNTAYQLNGGGIYINNVNLVVIDSDISRNISKNGGGIFMVGGRITMTNTTVKENVSLSDGAGIYAFPGGATNNSVFVNNRFIGNTSYENGGGMYLDTGNYIISNNSFVSNSSQDYGSALYIYGATNLFCHNTFSYHTFNRAVYTENDSDTWIGNIFKRNSAAFVLRVKNTELTLTGNTFLSNLNSTAVYTYAGTNHSVSNLFSCNKSAYYEGPGYSALQNDVMTGHSGKVIELASDKSVLKNVIISNNNIMGTNYVLHSRSDDTYLSNCLISGNTVYSGPVLEMKNSSGYPCGIFDSTIVNNVSYDDCGGIWARADITLSNCILSNNRGETASDYYWVKYNQTLTGNQFLSGQSESNRLMVIDPETSGYNLKLTGNVFSAANTDTTAIYEANSTSFNLTLLSNLFVTNRLGAAYYDSVNGYTTDETTLNTAAFFTGTATADGNVLTNF